jgi:hypothetical protein
LYVDESVASGEDGDGGEGFEAGGGAVETGLPGGDGLGCDALEALGGLLEAALGGGDADGGGLAAETLREKAEAMGGGAEAAGSGGFEAEA